MTVLPQEWLAKSQHWEQNWVRDGILFTCRLGRFGEGPHSGLHYREAAHSITSSARAGKRGRQFEAEGLWRSCDYDPSNLVG